MYKLIVKDNCPTCKDSISKITYSGLLNKVDIVHISTDEGLALAKEYNLKMAGSDIIDTDNQSKLSIDEFVNLNSK